MTQPQMTDEHDIDIVNNNMVLVDESTKVRQKLMQNLKTFQEEWFLDRTLGVPYFQLIFVKGTPSTVIDDQFKATIVGTEGVKELVEYEPLDLDRATRVLTVNFKVTDIYGTTIQIAEEII